MFNPIIKKQRRVAENILRMEANLIQKVSQGDASAFRQLFDHYRNRIYSLGMHLTRSETMAEELVQDAFMKVWENRNQLVSIHYFNAWLRTVAKNTCSNYLRSLAIERLAMHRISGSTVEATGSAENKVIVKEYEEIIDAAIRQLPPGKKSVPAEQAAVQKAGRNSPRAQHLGAYRKGVH